MSFPACSESRGFVVVFVVVGTAATTEVIGSKRLALLGGYAAMVRDLFVAGMTSFFEGGRFLGESVELVAELSRSYSSFDMLQKSLVLVSMLSGNRCVAMLCLAVLSATLLA